MSWSKSEFDYHPCGARIITRHMKGWVSWPFGAFREGGAWHLVNLPTGYEIDGRYRAPTLTAVKAAVRQLLPLARWHLDSAEEIIASAEPGLFHRVRAILGTQS